jgi:hypothetical protein
MRFCRHSRRTLLAEQRKSSAASLTVNISWVIFYLALKTQFSPLAKALQPGNSTHER